MKELVRRGEAIGPARPGEEFRAWLARAGADRDRQDLLGASNSDDVADPIGGAPSLFDQTAAEIEGLCVSLAALLWP